MFFANFKSKLNEHKTTRHLLKVNNRNTSTTCEVNHKDINVVLMSFLLTLIRFHILFWYFHCWFLTRKCRLGEDQMDKQPKLNVQYNRSYDILHVMWTPYVHSIYVLCGEKHFLFLTATHIDSLKQGY